MLKHCSPGRSPEGTQGFPASLIGSCVCCVLLFNKFVQVQKAEAEKTAAKKEKAAAKKAKKGKVGAVAVLGQADGMSPLDG